MKLNIKLKILFATSVVLLISTTFGLWYSYRLFTEDKTSYIFESTLRNSEQIADQINYKIKDAATKTEFSSLLYYSNAVNISTLLSAQEDMIALGEIDYTATNLKPSSLISNATALKKLLSEMSTTEDQLAQVLMSEIIKKRPEKKKQWIFFPSAQIALLICLANGNAPNKLVFSITALTSFFEHFSEDPTFKNMIIPMENIHLVLPTNPWIKNINYQTQKKGALEAKIGNVPTLLAFSTLSDQLLIISSISKLDAFKITHFLIFKTALFALILLGIALIFGIYFSSTITYPIRMLTVASRKLAGGDFDTRVSIHSSDEISVLGSTFNFMASEINSLLENKEELIKKLELYNQNLEAIVALRTKELKEAHDFMSLMVNSLDQGLLVFDEHLICHPTYTKVCEKLFGVSPSNKNITEVLGISEDEKIQQINDWAKILFNELIPFESAKNLGPQSKTFGIGYSDPHFKYIHLDYYPMISDDQKISNVVMIATDKSDELKAVEKAKENELHVEMLLKIVNNKTQFESFIQEVNDIFEQLKSTYSLTTVNINFEQAMMLFHTLNGGFSIYRIEHLRKMALECENIVLNQKTKPINLLDFLISFDEMANTFEANFKKFLIEIDQQLGTRFTENQSIVEIPRSTIEEFSSLLLNNSDKHTLHYYQDNFLKVPIIKYFKAYDDLCRVTASKLGKDFGGIVFTNENLKILPGEIVELFSVLIHLFRNCIDHGIETPHERRIAGKSHDGHIHVSFDLLSTNLQDFISIVIQDDGAGIDPNKIRKKYMRLHPEENLSELSDQQIIYKILDPFFSTKEQVTALSGRGVGLYAVKEVTDKLGGKIEVESALGKGTIFSLLIPIKQGLF